MTDEEDQAAKHFAVRATRLGRRIATADHCPKCGSDLSFKVGASWLIVHCIRLRCDHRKIFADVSWPPRKPPEIKRPPAEPGQPKIEEAF